MGMTTDLKHRGLRGFVGEVACWEREPKIADLARDGEKSTVGDGTPPLLLLLLFFLLPPPLLSLTLPSYAKVSGGGVAEDWVCLEGWSGPDLMKDE